MKKHSNFFYFTSWVMAGFMLASAAGCSSSRVVKKSSKELKAMEVTANAGRDEFFKQNYNAAARQIQPLATEMHVSKPLYECELASIALLAGDMEKAEARIREAIRLFEGLHDAAGEKSAASIWGSDNKKVYKGDPYERALIYALYGMFLLERGEVDNALASFKRSLLMDGDTEKSQYQSDFGLVQFLAAKCHDLRGEPDMRDTMLAEAFKSTVAVLDHLAAAEPRPGGKTKPNGFARAAQAEYDAVGKAGGAPTPWVAAVASWGGGRLKSLDGLSHDALAWLEQHLPADKGMGFNTLLVGWEGYGPAMVRVGEYGEKRLIVAGEKPDRRLAYSAALDGEFIDAGPWLGNITFQAVTRGGRPMDNILERQAFIKGTLDKSGNFMIATGAAGATAASSFNNNNNSNAAGIVTLVFFGIFVVGLIVKGVQYAMSVEADTRCWRCLPHAMLFIPLALPEGKSELALSTWMYNFSVAEKKVAVERNPGAAVTFAHVPLMGAEDPLPKFHGPLLLRQYIMSPETVDEDGDGELSTDEIYRAMSSALERYWDSTRNGMITEQTHKRMADDALKNMRKRLGFEK